MNTSISNKNYVNADSTAHVGSTDSASFGSTNTQGADAFGMISDLEMKLAMFFRQMRDTLRQYNEAQQKNTFEMAKTSFDTKMTSIQKDFDAGVVSAVGEIVGGLTSVAGSAMSLKQVGGENISQAWSGAGNGAGEAVKGSFDLGAKALSKDASELSAKADYQHSLADAASKRSDDTLDLARQASSDLKQMLDMIAQVHDRFTSALQVR